MTQSDDIATNPAYVKSTNPVAEPLRKKKKKKKKATKNADPTAENGGFPLKKQQTAPKIQQVAVKQRSSHNISAGTSENNTDSHANDNEHSKKPPKSNSTPPLSDSSPILASDGFATGYYGLLLNSKHVEQLCQSLMLSYRHIARLKKIFKKEDLERTGEITPDEFFSIILEEKRKLTTGIFEFVGLPKNPRRLKFDDFVLCIVTFASMSQEELLHFAFTLFDQDESGAMDARELKEFCGDLKNRGFFFQKNVQVAQKHMIHNETSPLPGDGLIDFQDMMKGSAQFPIAFYPILQMQRNIRAGTLGESFWLSVVQRKKQIEIIVHYMRLHNGHLPPFSLRRRLWSLFHPRIYILRKLAIVKYAAEQRQWELERAQKEEEKNALKLQDIEDTQQ